MPDTSIAGPFDAYNGSEPYVFVSYSHKDAEYVFVDIASLRDRGFRIWYDEGIDPGNEWTEAVATALKLCAFFVVYLSPNAVKSRNVRNEINLALKYNKPFLAIFLAETEMPAGLDLQIGSIQAVMQYRLNRSNYQKLLLRALPDTLRAPRPSRRGHADSGEASSLPTKLQPPVDPTCQSPDIPRISHAHEPLMDPSLCKSTAEDDLPIVIPADPRHPVRYREADAQVNRPRVLIVEDVGVTTLQIRKAFLKAGYTIAGEAVEGRQAVEMARELKPDLIIMDINMPGSMDGLEATRKILSHFAVPVIILASYSDDDYVATAIEAGACGYLVKPITSEQLLPAIKVAMARFDEVQASMVEAQRSKGATQTNTFLDWAKRILTKRKKPAE